jgi:hypothetical protein
VMMFQSAMTSAPAVLAQRRSTQAGAKPFAYDPLYVERGARGQTLRLPCPEGNCILRSGDQEVCLDDRAVTSPPAREPR